MSIALGEKYSEKDYPLEYKQAVTRVWGRLPSVENAAHWLLSFSFADTVNLSATKWYRLRWECVAFACPTGFPTREVFIPLRPHLKQIQRWVRKVWEKLGKDEVVEISGGIRHGYWRGDLYTENDRIVGFSRPQSHSPSYNDFEILTFQVLASPDLDGKFRFCKRDKCRRPFLAIKRQAFCSASCSQHHRTSLYRTRNREQFREKRREYYARKQRERTK
jgi:hypothetical protein